MKRAKLEEFRQVAYKHLGFAKDATFSRPKSFPEPLSGVHLSLGTQSAKILSESTFQGTGVVGELRVQWKRSLWSAQKRRLKP
ncbi:MAG: hypothetical protein KME57_06760 [Scytonema hyalinum WJT4-NPBG1]|jgi:hypothetical protein|nr:hypothetical protein [Scytonema hyalinum WJT4-NPBG1]